MSAWRSQKYANYRFAKKATQSRVNEYDNRHHPLYQTNYDIQNVTSNKIIRSNSIELIIMATIFLQLNFS